MFGPFQQPRRKEAPKPLCRHSVRASACSTVAKVSQITRGDHCLPFSNPRQMGLFGFVRTQVFVFCRTLQTLEKLAPSGETQGTRVLELSFFLRRGLIVIKAPCVKSHLHRCSRPLRRHLCFELRAEPRGKLELRRGPAVDSSVKRIWAVDASYIENLLVGPQSQHFLSEMCL